MHDNLARPDRDPARLFARPNPVVETLPDGSQRARSADSLKPYGRSVTDWLVQWAARTPDRVFLQERTAPTPDAPWRKMTYAQTLSRVEALAAGLLSLGLGPEKPRWWKLSCTMLASFPLRARWKKATRSAISTHRKKLTSIPWTPRW